MDIGGCGSTSSGSPSDGGKGEGMDYSHLSDSRRPATEEEELFMDCGTKKMNAGG